MRGHIRCGLWQQRIIRTDFMLGVLQLVVERIEEPKHVNRQELVALSTKPSESIPLTVMNTPVFAFSAELREHIPNSMPPLLLELLGNVFPLHYKMTNSSSKNSFQLNSTFDQELVARLLNQNVKQTSLEIPSEFSSGYTFDAAFILPGVGKVVVEVEKADHKKILYDLLKAHIYLRAGADCVVLLIPTARGRKGEVNRMFEIGRKRFTDCMRSGMMSEGATAKIFLVGFEQKYQNEGFNECHRKQIQEECRAYWERWQQR